MSSSSSTQSLSSPGLAYACFPEKTSRIDMGSFAGEIARTSMGRCAYDAGLLLGGEWIDDVAEFDRACGGRGTGVICLTTLVVVDDPEPALRWYFCIGEDVRRWIDPAELWLGDLRCRGCIEKLLIDDGREEWLSNSELGVWLPNERLPCTWGESSGTICEAPEERRELTELDLRDEIEWRWARPLDDPNLLPDPLPLRPDDI
ncbi:hypothetical protein NLJ89_g12121 [Agrocybe chaxingu]|uniref:Uncharacterized protein n=1 Tax=Agrocybe chaxingu TaxID=84603 RepID=A0A9W8JMX1_9AGAR|nr:hypothetical protein NLJ89_g12121 [Agrocybe chaxingu]